MRRRNRRKLKKQRKMIIISSFILLITLSVGYASFQTNITLNAKGNINKLTTLKKLKQEITTTGDGLYKDTLEDGRYIYRGANPNNYIKLGNDLYRIISVENDETLKVIKNEGIGSLSFDLGYIDKVDGITDENSNEGTRYSDNSNDYCYFEVSTEIYNYYGCNIWGSNKTMLDTNGNHINKMSKNKTDNVYNLPEKEAYINTYLNNTWINSLNIDIRNIIETHYFNVGPIYILEDTLSDNINYEKRYKWQGKIGLMSAIDFIKASSSDTCAGGKFYSSTDCLENNYLYNSLGELTRTITPSIASSNAYDVITVHNYIHNRALGPDGARNKRTIAPTFYLSKDIKLQGTGEKNNPFTILN